MLFDKRTCGDMMGQCPMMGPEVTDDGRMGFGCNPCSCNPCGCSPCGNDPIMEDPIERCVRRDICHEVKHICPVHTKVINNHICRHVYVPCFSCSEENVVTNLDQGSCCNFM